MARIVSKNMLLGLKAGEVETFTIGSRSDLYKAAWDKGYRAGLEAAQPKWISVEEPPKHTCDYLVYVWVAYPDGFANMQMRTGTYNVARKEWTIPHGRFEVVGEPECWMSLPEPPKEDV